MPDATPERYVAGEITHRPEHDAKPLSTIFKSHYMANLLSIIYAVVLAMPPHIQRCSHTVGLPSPRIAGATPACCSNIFT